MPPSSLSSLTWPEARDWLLGAPVQVAVIIVVAVVARWLLLRLVERGVATATSRQAQRIARLPGLSGRAPVEATGVGAERHMLRARTMGAVLRSVITIVVGTIALLTILAVVGIPLGPMLASAGIGGVALGFGAQSLVKDFLSGIFMIVEDQYGVGDVIDTGEVVGTVEDVSLRVTRLRDAHGVAWYVRNGEIIRIGNKSQGWSTALVDVPIAYDEDVERAQSIIRDVAAAMAQDETWKPALLEPPQVPGVESIGGGAITVRVTAKCAAEQHFGVQRELRERIKLAFDGAGVRGPAPLLPPYGKPQP
ncbi:MAG: mechanosensitive ion channel family protein [Intrasporangium sp.]|uniref:mechanosensitive ion channel family protein n=1 Tax=Intrasporangium sp. TaxID=1925024 RepID=UPI0026489969|nr:mechanosensitive ion channel family protein [Intrasporangium sp.]MDN5795298.1 mechanosensitive ion channel family protein [Intrasporangium sp.]